MKQGYGIPTAPVLNSGDRLVFFGDSITAHHVYTRYVMDYFALRHPGMDISFRNAGLGSDTAPGALSRLERDVLSLKPTVVSICFGMNDGDCAKYSQQIGDRFVEAMRQIIDTLKHAGVRVALLTPGCVDTDLAQTLIGSDWNYNDTLGELARLVLELAAQEQVPCFDLHSLMLDVLKKSKETNVNAMFGYRGKNDGVHPLDAGHAVMAYALIKTLGCKEQRSGLEIDAEAGLIKPDRCSLANLTMSASEIGFTRTDQALPIYFDNEVTAVANYLPLMEDLNQYRFKVTGLKSPSWKLTVENIDVGSFTNAQLAEGVNLAPLPGPWHALAREIDKLSLSNEEQFGRWQYFGQMKPPVGAETEHQALWHKVNQVLEKEEKARQQAAMGHYWRWKLTSSE